METRMRKFRAEKVRQEKKGLSSKRKMGIRVGAKRPVSKMVW